jgi:hypothetical protein
MERTLGEITQMHEEVDMGIKSIVKRKDLLNKRSYSELILENTHDLVLHLERKKRLLKFKRHILACGAEEREVSRTWEEL